jgi:hypothetical protein
MNNADDYVIYSGSSSATASLPGKSNPMSRLRSSSRNSGSTLDIPGSSSKVTKYCPPTRLSVSDLDLKETKYIDVCYDRRVQELFPS